MFLLQKVTHTVHSNYMFSFSFLLRSKDMILDIDQFFSLISTFRSYAFVVIDQIIISLLAMDCAWIGVHFCSDNNQVLNMGHMITSHNLILLQSYSVLSSNFTLV